MASVQLSAEYEMDAWERIIYAARDDFGKQGYRGAQVEHIARKADVSKQSIYYYFKSKCVLYQETIHFFTRSLLERLDNAEFNSPDPVADIHKFFGMIYDFYEESPSFAHITIDFSRQVDLEKSGQAARKIFGIFESLIDRANAHGLLRANIDKVSYFSFASFVMSGSFIDPGKAWALQRDCDPVSYCMPHRETVLMAIENMLGIKRSCACGQC